ncbi:hypothetical protein JHK82_053392 [Glycine max]|nr:hypothetical protein JHK82_053392 [Glycine max]
MSLSLPFAATLQFFFGLVASFDLISKFENSVWEGPFLFSAKQIAGAFVLMATNENLPPNVIKQLAKELKNLDESPPEGIKVVVNDDDFSTIFADIEGPAGTPYENGVFRMKLLLSHDFPHSPPKGVVRCLLIEPFPESALNEQAGKMLLENYEEYARHARLYTGIHAKPKPKFKSGAISESTTALNVDQTNTSVISGDIKTTPASAALPVPVLATTTTRGNNQEQAAAVNGSSAATVISAASAPPKKEGGQAKAQADKKKIDARKKRTMPNNFGSLLGKNFENGDINGASNGE